MSIVVGIAIGWLAGLVTAGCLDWWVLRASNNALTEARRLHAEINARLMARLR